MRLVLLPLAVSITLIRGCDVDMRPISERMRDSTAAPARVGKMEDEVIADGVRWRVEDGRLVGEREEGEAATPERPGPLSAGDAVWTTVRAWSGTGFHTTESFAVRTPIWRVVAEGSTSHASSFLRVGALDDGGDRLAYAAREGEGSDTLYVARAPGVFHLDVSAASMRWTVRVEEMRLPAERIARP